MDPHLVLVSEHEEDRAITLVQEAGSRGTKKKVLRMEGVRVQFIVFWFSPSRDVLLRRKKKKKKKKRKEKKRTQNMRVVCVCVGGGGDKDQRKE